MHEGMHLKVVDDPYFCFNVEPPLPLIPDPSPRRGEGRRFPRPFGDSQRLGYRFFDSLVEWLGVPSEGQG